MEGYAVVIAIEVNCEFWSTAFGSNYSYYSSSCLFVIFKDGAGHGFLQFAGMLHI
jgi:hypothetical protein